MIHTYPFIYGGNTFSGDWSRGLLLLFIWSGNELILFTQRQSAELDRVSKIPAVFFTEISYLILQIGERNKNSREYILENKGSKANIFTHNF